MEYGFVPCYFLLDCAGLDLGAPTKIEPGLLASGRH